MAQAKNTQARTHVMITQKDRVIREERTALFGLIRWWVEVSREKISDDLIIHTDIEIENIYVNGLRLNNHGKGN